MRELFPNVDLKNFAKTPLLEKCEKGRQTAGV